VAEIVQTAHARARALYHAQVQGRKMKLKLQRITGKHFVTFQFQALYSGDFKSQHGFQFVITGTNPTQVPEARHLDVGAHVDIETKF
jgi:hypothetical protein